MTTAEFTNELRRIAANTSLFAGDTKDVFTLLAQQLSTCLKVERINIWMFNENHKRIECLGNYISSSGEFSSGDTMRMKDAPEYYTRLKSSLILIVNDVHTSPITVEIKSSYCQRHGITSLLDVPIHVQGELKGVVCYEHVGPKRLWRDEEVHFALAANQLLAMALESKEREIAEQQMRASVQEKELLLKEMNHRIKNNLSLLISLLRMQSRESDNEQVKSILNDCESRIFSMARIHEQLYLSQNYLEVNLGQYLHQLVTEFRKSNFGSLGNVTYKTEFDPVILETSRAINLGLIVNEIMNNMIKHAFDESGEEPKVIEISLKQLVSSMILEIKDNGSGFDPTKRNKNSLGISLIEDLSEQIDAKLRLQSDSDGTTYLLQLSL